MAGKTLVFGKADTMDRFTAWHQSKVVTIVQAFLRYVAFVPRLKRASYAKAVIVNRWKRMLKLRKKRKAINQIQARCS